MRPEVVPLLVVALLLLSLEPGVGSITAVVDGDQTLPGEADAVVVLDGTVTLPAGAERSTSVYVVGGSAVIDGSLDGSLTQLSGDVAVGDSGAVSGEYQVLGGDRSVAPGAAVDPTVVAEPVVRERSLGEQLGLLVLQSVVLALAGLALGRRAPDLLANVDHAVRHHPVVSGTVGLLASVSLLALFVFMAFTVVLLPVSLLGLLGGVVVALYAYLCVGYVLGRQVLPDRPGVATAVGAVAFSLAGRLAGYVPVVGDLLSLLVLAVAVGAVGITYFGLREFHPPELPPVEG